MQGNNIKTQISEIPGGFSILPNALIGFISDKACSIFLKIYQCQYILEKVELDGEEWVQISGPFLTTSLRKVNRNIINNAINELVGLNIIRSKAINRKQRLYNINWEEIQFMCKVLNSVDFEGRNKIQDICIQKDFTPISAISSDIRDEIVRTHPRRNDSYPNSTNNGTFVSKSYEPQDSYPNSTNKKEIRIKNDTNMSGSYPKRTNVDGSYENDTNIDLHQNYQEQDTISESGSYPNRTNNSQGSYPNRTNVDEIRIQNVHNIYIREKNKKKYEEAKLPKEINKEKIENAERLLDFFNSRDNSLPVFDKLFLESFLEAEVVEEDDDVMKSVKVVWSQLDYDYELPDNNFIDLYSFYNILYHSWKQLKEDYPDYSLSENDMKNIFGFAIMEHEGEDCLYIDPSKIRDIKATPQKVKTRPSKNYQYSDRTSRRLFLDCIDEIGNKNIDLLTSSEYLVILLMDYASEHHLGAFSAELTRLAYKVLIEEFSGQCGLSIEVVEYLLKDLPQKSKVKINPQLLIPDKFFKYNHEHDEESEVEKLFLKKLEEERGREEAEGVDVDEFLG